MLQIYIFGDDNGNEGFMDIDPGTSLDLEALADLFDEDLSTGEFSLPVSIPWTDKNKRLTGFAERLENGSNRKNWWKCHVYDDAQPQMLSAKITLLEKAGNFNYRKGKSNFTISSTKGLFGAQIANKKLTDLVLDQIAWFDDDSRQFAYKVMTGVYPQYDYFTFAPVAIEAFINTTRIDFTSEFLAEDTVNDVVVNGSTWTFGRPLSSNPLTAAPPGNVEYNDYRTVPFFKLKYIIRKMFEQFGYTVSGAFLDEAGFDDLVVFNNFGIENYSPTALLDFNRSIQPAQHLPNILIQEFIKAVAGFFCCYPTYGVNEVKFNYRKSNFTNKNILSLNGIVADQFDSTLPVVQQGGIQTGYKLGYTWDTNDQYYNDRLKDLTTKTLVATVARRSDLDSLTGVGTLTTDCIAYVQADNLYYVVADATTIPVKWEVWGENLNPYNSLAALPPVQQEGAQDVQFNISTLCTYAKLNTTTGLIEKKNYLGTNQPGSYINNMGVKVVADFGLRIFFTQLRAIDAATIPVSFNNNRNANNDMILPYSLAWNGVDGMAASFHTRWQDFKLNAEIVKTKGKPDEKIMTDLVTHNVYEIDGVQFLPYQVNRTIPRKGDFELQIVPL